MNSNEINDLTFKSDRLLGSINLRTRVHQGLRKSIVVTKNGRPTRMVLDVIAMHKADLIARQIVDTAAKGDLKAAVLVVSQVWKPCSLNSPLFPTAATTTRSTPCAMSPRTGSPSSAARACSASGSAASSRFRASSRRPRRSRGALRSSAAIPRLTSPINQSEWRRTMDIANDGPRWGERSLTHQLKAKSRRRREGLERLRSPSPARVPRNDPLPNLDLAYIALEDLRMPSREIRKLDPAHVRKVANAISTLGFCAVGSEPGIDLVPSIGYGETMCGRARLSTDVSEIKLVFSIPPHRPTPNFPPSGNGAPSDLLPVVRYDAKAGERSLDLLRWGLVSHWAKDLKVGFANINAKAEGIETRPAFRDAFERRRCLVPVDNFYEVAEDRRGKTALRHRARRPPPDGAGGPVGKLAVTGGRMGAQLCRHHHHAKRPVRPTARPHAGRSQTRGLAGLAGSGDGRRRGAQGPPETLPIRRDDLLAGQRPRWQRPE